MLQKYRNNYSLSLLASFTVPVVFFLIAFGLSNFPHIFQYDADEGIVVMTAALYNKGYILYKQIWLDQPPFFVLLIASSFKLFGSSVPVARCVVLVLSSLLLWGLFRIISKAQNIWAALFAVSTLVVTSYYVDLSVSAMRGLPALAFAVLACHSLWVYQGNDKKRYLVFSACFFAAAVMTKLFAVYLLPGLIAQLLWGKRGEDLFEKRARAALWWGIMCAAVCCWAFFIATSIDYSQLLLPHIMMREIKIHVLFPGFDILKLWFGEEWDILLVVLAGFLATTAKERKFSLIPCLSFIAGSLLIAVHYPVWYSYRPLLFIPMCWLASFGVYKITQRETWEKLKNDIKNHGVKIREVLALAFLLFAVLFSVVQIPMVKVPRLIDKLNGAGEPLANYQKLIDMMKQYDKQVLANASHMVVTDYPIIPFYAGLDVPPYLVTASIMRIKTKLLTEKDFIRIIDEENPSMVLFGRNIIGHHAPTHLFDRIRNKTVSYIKLDYILRYRDPNLYVSLDVDDR